MPTVLDAEELADALAFADLATLLLLDARIDETGTQAGVPVAERGFEDLGGYRAEIDQATGMLTDHHASLGVTLVDHSDRSTGAVLEAWGWQDVGRIRRPSEPTGLRLMVLPLGERTAEHPDGLAHNARTQRPE